MKNVVVYEKPLALEDIGVSCAPQSYRYISWKTKKYILEQRKIYEKNCRWREKSSVIWTIFADLLMEDRGEK